MLSNFLCAFLNRFLRKVRGQQAMEKLRRCRSCGAGGVCPASLPCSACGMHEPALRAGAPLRGWSPRFGCHPRKTCSPCKKPGPPLFRHKTEAQPERRVRTCHKLGFHPPALVLWDKLVLVSSAATTLALTWLRPRAEGFGCEHQPALGMQPINALGKKPLTWGVWRNCAPGNSGHGD